MRVFPFILTTPSVIVASKDGRYSKTPFERVDIQPNVFKDHGNRIFEDFLDCVEGLVGKIKQTTAEVNLDINYENWISPVKFRDGMLHGMVAKVRNPAIRNLLASRRNDVKLVLELKFCYSSAQYCGISFEVVDVIPIDEEKKEGKKSA